MSIFALRSNGLASSAYKNLSRAQTSLTDNISRLASGLRINKTADDSAGSNVSVRMGNQVSGMAQANTLTQNILSLLRWYEMNSLRSNRNLMIHNRTQGLDNIADILGQMREIAVQAVSTNTTNFKRVSLELEFQMLKNEITRIGESMEHNNISLNM